MSWSVKYFAITICRTGERDKIHIIGNGEVDSSILSGSTIQSTEIIADFLLDFDFPDLRKREGTTA